MSGPSRFMDDQFFFPKPLVEIDGKTLMEIGLTPFLSISDAEFIAIIKSSDDQEFKLGNVIRRIMEPRNCEIITLFGDTRGALCTSLLSIEAVDPDEELLIANYDQYFDFPVENAIEYFRDQDLDFGLVSFESPHPKWSFVRLDGDGFVVEAAEKNPISKNALAGLYYFKNSKSFFDAAKQTILESASDKQNFFVSDCINTCVLSGSAGKAYPIKREQYWKFYDAPEVNEFKGYLRRQLEEQSGDYLWHQYISAISTKDLEVLGTLIRSDATFNGPNSAKFNGRNNILSHFKSIFEANDLAPMNANRIFSDQDRATIALEFLAPDKTRKVVHLIAWEGNQIKNITTYAG